MSDTDITLLDEINKYTVIPMEEMREGDITIGKIQDTKGCCLTTARNIFYRMIKSGEYKLVIVRAHGPGIGRLKVARPV